MCIGQLSHGSRIYPLFAHTKMIEELRTNQCEVEILTYGLLFLGQLAQRCKCMERFMEVIILYLLHRGELDVMIIPYRH